MNILYFDLETTGRDSNSEIIQIYCEKHMQDGSILTLERFFDYKGEMNPEAEEKHGLTKEFLRDYELFSDSYKEIEDFFIDADVLSGFNVVNFDIPVLVNNLLNAGSSTANSIMKKKTIDVLNEWRLAFPNTLEAVYKRCTGEELSGAHNASNDIKATISILNYLRENVGAEIEPKVNTRIDANGFFVRNESNEIIFAKGKYKDHKLKDINRSECVNYLEWIAYRSNMDKSTVQVAIAILSVMSKK